MEFTLHRQLKTIYAAKVGLCEQRVQRYRIDVIREGRLIEIQFGPLFALKKKLRCLLATYPVLLVKPVIATKLIEYRQSSDGATIIRRRSPQRRDLWDVFHELVHLVELWQHGDLILEIPLLHVLEIRRAMSPRRNKQRPQVLDRHLMTVQQTYQFSCGLDWLSVLPPGLPDPFTTAELASMLQLPRWWAQQVAYCLRHLDVFVPCRRSRQGWLYRLRRAA
ncbi:MAG: hypothetical protein KatS3mg113_0599 [Planctomycetaceae bacterium]|nr:MAG: hypothetical protein KatS3mg113_0599 [Planctomycetaceae bacterium]